MSPVDCSTVRRHGFRMMSHKRPSASDHAEAMELSAFVGRGREHSTVEDCWVQSKQARKLAIIEAASQSSIDEHLAQA